MREVTKDGKDDGAGQERREGVGKADDQGILVCVVSELVVRAIGGQSTKANTQGEERLSHGRIPNLETENSNSKNMFLPSISILHFIYSASEGSSLDGVVRIEMTNNILRTSRLANFSH